MKTRTLLSRRLLQAALAALLLRALVPVGMMAAPVTDGWLFKLCPSGMSMSSYMALLGHEHEHEHKQEHEHAQDEADPVCGLSAGFAAIAGEPDTQYATAIVRLGTVSTPFPAHPVRAPPRAHRPRLPPSVS